MGKRAAALKVESKPSEASSGGSEETRNRTLVFISHDSRDCALAEAFQNLLADASGGILKSFCSSDKRGNSGIEFGEEWYKAIMKNLDMATNVVALLTKNSLNRPWILYEAGVAKGKLTTPVLGLVVGIPLEEANKGPFAQFQNCADDEDSLTKLITQLIRQHPDAEPREAAVRLQVQAFRKAIEKLPESKAEAKKNAEVDPTIVAKLFEEIKVMFRDLPEKLDGTIREASARSPKRPAGRTTRHLFHRLSGRMGEAPLEVAATYWLSLVAMYREMMPSLYEVGAQLVQAVKSGDRRLAITYFECFHDAIHALEESRPQSEDEYELVRAAHELVPMFDHFILSRLLKNEVKSAKRLRTKE